MKRRLAPLPALLLTGFLASAQAPQNSKDALSIALPSELWILVFDASGFKVERNGLQPDGRAYLLANNESTQVTLSVLLERVPGQATEDGCKENQKKRLAQNVDYKREDIQTKEANGMAIVEYTIPEFRGAPIQQRNLLACLAKDDAYVDIHLSKILFKPDQEELLNTVLNSAHFVDKGPNAREAGGSGRIDDARLDEVREGSRYFVQQNYAASIDPYQKALDAEKQSRKLPQDLWRALVDNLGMAYGITGDLNHAEETFNYGLSQDPTYPMFYYNLACVAAGRNDMDKTMGFLRKAFSYKANIIPGGSMPDPRKDDSFRPFMSDRRFREFLNTL